MRLCNDGDNDAYTIYRVVYTYTKCTNADAMGIIILTIVVDLYSDVYTYTYIIFYNDTKTCFIFYFLPPPTTAAGR